MISRIYHQLLAVIALLVITVKTYAQDGLDIDIDMDTNDTPAIFERPLFWVGVAIVVLLLAMILRKKK